MKVEKANIADAPMIHRLVNHYAQKGDMLARSLSEIYETLRDFFVVRENDEVIACVALHICWDDLAEIKALAVSEHLQRAGMGTALGRACIEEANELGMASIFCLTYKPTFFERLGFHQVDVLDLPRKVWGECQRCAKFPHCDETALVMNLKPAKSVQWPETLVGERDIGDCVYRGRRVKVCVDDVELPSGRMTTREIVLLNDAIAIVPIDADDNVVLVKQYRHSIGQTLLEIPAGKVELGETPIECARRELWEETGFSAAKVEELGGFYASPGYATEYLYLFTAGELESSCRIPDSDEISAVVKVPLAKIPEMIDSGEIRDAKSVAGLLRVLGPKYK